MSALATFVGAIPLLIANYYRSNHLLKDETIYLRHDINAINLFTLKNLLENNISPHKLAMPGSKVSIKINNENLNSLIEKVSQSTTKSDISKKLSISRQSLSSYQTGQSNPSEETFEKMITFFNTFGISLSKSDLLNPVNLLDESKAKKDDLDDILQNNQLDLKGFQQEVNQKLDELDFKCLWFNSLPWDGLSTNTKPSGQEKKIFFFTGVEDKEQINKMVNRIITTQNVVKLFKNKGVWIVQDESVISDIENYLPENQSDIKILPFDQLYKIKSDKELNTKLK